MKFALVSSEPLSGVFAAIPNATNKYSTSETTHTYKLFANSAHSERATGLIRASAADSTWRKHRSALNCFETFECSSGTHYDWPLSNNALSEFAAWAVSVRNLLPSTVKSYLSSISVIHELRGFDAQNCCTPTVKRILQGSQNLQFYTDISKCTRKVMTLPLMKLLGHGIKNSGWDTNSQQVVWTAAVVAFCGAFRMGELLCNNKWSFNPHESLLWSDIVFNKDDSLVIHLKMEKSRNPKGVYIDLFRVPDFSFCPVASLALLKCLSTTAVTNNKPVFSFSSGKLLTRDIFIRSVQEILTPFIGNDASGIQGHSFRAGIPAAMADCPALADDEEIKCWGRWTSDSFLLYTRLKHNKRKAIFLKIMSLFH